MGTSKPQVATAAQKTISKVRWSSSFIPFPSLQSRPQPGSWSCIDLPRFSFPVEPKPGSYQQDGHHLGHQVQPPCRTKRQILWTAVYFRSLQVGSPSSILMTYPPKAGRLQDIAWVTMVLDHTGSYLLYHVPWLGHHGPGPDHPESLLLFRVDLSSFTRYPS